MLRRLVILAAIFLFTLPLKLSAQQADGDRQRRAEVFERLKAGSAHLERGETDEAVREFKRVLALDSRSAAGHMLLGQAYLAMRSVSMVAEAKAELQQALDLDPTLLWARFYLAKVYIDQGRYDRAKEELETGLAQRPKVPHFLSLLGEVHRKTGDPELAIQLNQQAVDLDSSLTPAHYYIGLAYMDLKKEDQAIAALERSIASPYVAPEMYLTLGSLYARKKRFKEGEELCRKAVALDPSRPEAHVNLAQLYNTRGASDQALEELKLAVEGKSFPSSPYYQQLQADVFYEKGRAYQAKHMLREAIGSYVTALELNPNEGRTHKQLAEVYLRSGDRVKAMQHASMAEKLGNPVDSALRSEMLEGMGRAHPSP